MPFCRFCGKEFQSLGIARHETACYERLKRKVYDLDYEYQDGMDEIGIDLDDAIDYISERMPGLSRVFIKSIIAPHLVEESER